MALRGVYYFTGSKNDPVQTTFGLLELLSAAKNDPVLLSIISISSYFTYDEALGKVTSIIVDNLHRREESEALEAGKAENVFASLHNRCCLPIFTASPCHHDPARPH